MTLSRTTAGPVSPFRVSRIVMSGSQELVYHITPKYPFKVTQILLKSNPIYLHKSQESLDNFWQLFNRFEIKMGLIIPIFSIITTLLDYTFILKQYIYF